MKAKRWSSVILLLMLSMAVALTGCGGSGGGGNKAAGTNTGTNTGAEAPAGSAQDTLIVGRGGDSSSLDPAIVTDGESLKITHQIFDSLLEYKEGTTEVQPSLAEEWTVSEDGLKYTFKLRQGVKFHDGTDFNADAVVFNFTRWSDPKSEYKFEGDSFDYYDSMFGPDGKRVIKEVKAIDDNTVEFTLNQPQAPFLQNLAMTSFGIASPTAIKEKKENFKNEPVGTGPFVFKEWKRNDSITLDKNPNYWKEGLPKLNKVIVRSIPDNSARFNALQSGEIDLMEDLTPDDLATLESNPDLQKITRPSNNVGYVGFNLKKEPFNDVKVRTALSYAVNKQGIIDAFFAGQAEPAKNPMPPSLWGYNDSIQDYEYDLEKAKQLLAEAGYPNGLPGEYTFYAMPVSRPYMPDGKKVAEVIQADFEKIGVKVNIESPEWATYLDDAQAGEKDDLFMLGWQGDNGDPDNFLYTLLDKDAIPSNNYSYYANDELHELLKQAQVETEQTKREELYKKAQEIIKADAPWIPLVHTTPLLAAKANVKGYVASPTGTEYYSNIYFE
ncbi:ABC transporter substrate-binding protein [Paenibacillus macerans]|uniref:ABC transporter substrate-binding protein n=1 Tax=Paenibacillus macerans TaxID=44252 RepID=UPI001F116C25|nr:ABC transporter substrate-binding protein [Paenibacillus macerans]MED4957390.1 ABC transporter substrate-binding protein [Paenibacillus macerans]UMV47518.1 ABC transporter substrate-binding protein [Paenibacillus macerans]